MALEMFKCSCGAEFEDSEFSVSRECMECRASTAPPTHNFMTAGQAYQFWQQTQASYQQMQWSQSLYSMGIDPITYNTTITYEDR